MKKATVTQGNRNPARPRKWGGRQRRKDKALANRTSKPLKLPALPAIPADVPRIYSAAEINAMRPREALDAIHAMQAWVEYHTTQGQLMSRSEVESREKAQVEVFRNDLLGTLPARLAGTFAGKAVGYADAMHLVRAEVRLMILAWSQGGASVPEEVKA